MLVPFVVLTAPLYMNAGITRIHDIYGPEFIVPSAEIQGLLEMAEDSFYRAEYIAAYAAVETALNLAEAKFGKTSREVANILTFKGQGLVLLGDFVAAEQSLGLAVNSGRAVLGDKHALVGRAVMELSGVKLGLGSMSVSTVIDGGS